MGFLSSDKVVSFICCYQEAHLEENAATNVRPGHPNAAISLHDKTLHFPTSSLIHSQIKLPLLHISRTQIDNASKCERILSNLSVALQIMLAAGVSWKSL